MAQSLRNLPYEERLTRLKLLTLEKRRETRLFITKGLEKIDSDDLFVWDDRTTRGHEKKLKRNTCKRHKNIQLPI